MKKDQFIKRIQLIQNFHSEQETLNLLIDKLVDGFPVVDMGNYLVNEILEMINETMEIKDKNLLSWWLYEDVEKVMYDGDREISVRSIEELYDYIKKEYK